MMKYTVLSLLFVSFATSASYINSCVLKVKVFDYQQITELSVKKHPDDKLFEIQKFTIEGVVTDAKKKGRADSGCDFYLGSNIKNTFDRTSIFTPNLIKGNNVYISVYTIGAESPDDKDSTEFTLMGIAP